MSSNGMNLKDRVAIVTGGGHGIGRAFSIGLAKTGVKVTLSATPT